MAEKKKPHAERNARVQVAGASDEGAVFPSEMQLHVDGKILAIPSSDPMAIRAAWMRIQGLPEDEILEMCDPDTYPGTVAEELENLRAAQELRQSSLTGEELDDLAQRHPPPADW
jgi:hypothetical protein